MLRSRFTEDQILAILAEGDAGVSRTELARRHGISRQTFLRWKARFGGLQIDEARRLRQLEDENRGLKSSSPISLSNAMLKDGRSQVVTTKQRQSVVTHFSAAFERGSPILEGSI